MDISVNGVEVVESDPKFISIHLSHHTFYLIENVVPASKDVA